MHNLTEKRNVLHINGNGNTKKSRFLLSVRVAGLAFMVTTKYNVKENLRTLQSPIIAPHTENSYYANYLNLAFSCHTNPNNHPQNISYPLVAFNSVVVVSKYLSSNLVVLKLT